jgi:hypothetical protein
LIYLKATKTVIWQYLFDWERFPVIEKGKPMNTARNVLLGLLAGTLVAIAAYQGNAEAQAQAKSREQIVEMCLSQMRAQMRKERSTDTASEANRNRGTNLYRDCMAKNGQPL